MRNCGTVNPSLESLDELVPMYANLKGQADDYTKAAKAAGDTIKTLLGKLDVNSYSAGGYKVTKVVANKESMNEAMLLSVAHKYKLPVIRTVEVVDVDALENYVYNNELPDDIAADLAKCRTTQAVIQLRIKKEK